MGLSRYFAFTLALVVGSFASAADGPFGANLKTVSCPIFSGLTKQGREQALDMRPKALSYCLVCQGAQCAMKIWPSERHAEATLCKRLFCTPTKPQADVFNDEDRDGNAKRLKFAATFTYKINKRGRGELLKLTRLSGDLSERELERKISKGLARLKFEPLVIDGEVHEIVNLEGRVERTKPGTVRFF